MVKAAICREFKQDLSIEDITLDPPAAGEVQVKIKACAICHSDLFYMDGAWGGELPAIYGHEAVGIVSALGAGVSDFTLGERVLVTLIRACGKCTPCLEGSQVLCSHKFELDHKSPIKDQQGNAVTHGLRTAAFAESVVVDQSQLVALSDHIGPVDIKDSVACLLSCGVITGLGAVVNTAKMQFGAKVAVIGCGGVGLNIIQGAFLTGAAEIIAIDIEPTKLETAKQFGATNIINSKTDDVEMLVKDYTAGERLDYVFVSVGVKAAFDQALKLLGRRGKMILVGMPPSGVEAVYDPGMMASLDHHIIGSKMGDTMLALDMPKLLSLYRHNRLKLDELVSHCYPLDQINHAIAEVRQGKILRNVILME